MKAIEDYFKVFYKCDNDDIKKIYAHDDCAAFADILHWDFEDKGFDSKVIMAGTKFQNHFYVRIKNDEGACVYCDAYGTFKKETDILDRYDMVKEETYEVQNPDENKLFQTLIESSYLFNNLEETDEREELFFLGMSKVLKDWELSLVETNPQIKKQKSMKVVSKPIRK